MKCFKCNKNIASVCYACYSNEITNNSDVAEAYITGYEDCKEKIEKIIESINEEKFDCKVLYHLIKRMYVDREL